MTTKKWNTPMAWDKTGPSYMSLRKPAMSEQSLTFQAKSGWDSRPAPKALKRGLSGSPRGDLNPFFVAELMGLPADWLTPSTSEVTDWCRKQRQRRGRSSATASPKAEPCPA